MNDNGETWIHIGDAAARVLARIAAALEKPEEPVPPPQNDNAKPDEDAA